MEIRSLCVNESKTVLLNRCRQIRGQSVSGHFRIVSHGFGKILFSSYLILSLLGGGGGNRKGYLIASRRLEEGGGVGLLEKKAYFKRVSCPWMGGGGGGSCSEVDFLNRSKHWFILMKSNHTRMKTEHNITAIQQRHNFISVIHCSQLLSTVFGASNSYIPFVWKGGGGGVRMSTMRVYQRGVL